MGVEFGKIFFLLNDKFSLKKFPLDQRNSDVNHPVMGINDMRVSAITWAKTLMMLRETNRFVHSDFRLGVAKKQNAILGGKKIRLCFFSCYQLCSFFSLYCITFWRDKLLNFALEYAPSLF